MNARGPCSVCNRPGPPARFATGQVGVCGQAASAPRPAPQGCTRHHALGGGGSVAAPAHPANPAWRATPRWRGHRHRSRPGTRSSQGGGMAAGGTTTPSTGGPPQLAGGGQLRGSGLPPVQRLAGAGERLTRSASAGVTGALGQRRGAKGGGIWRGVRWNTARGPPAPGTTTPDAPCPRPAACFAAAKAVSASACATAGTGLRGDPSGWTWWSGEQWRGPPATGAFAMCNRAWRWN